MNKEIKAKWIEALRSGKYKQGKAALRTENNEYCCLGVLCELAVNEGVINPPVVKEDDNFTARSRIYSFEGCGGYLPKAVQTWAWLEDDDGRFMSVINGLDNLASLNDHGTSFEEIAKVIEEKF